MVSIVPREVLLPSERAGNRRHGDGATKHLLHYTYLVAAVEHDDSVCQLEHHLALPRAFAQADAS